MDPSHPALENLKQPGAFASGCFYIYKQAKLLYHMEAGGDYGAA